jgi:hypothetical protein
VECFKGRVDRPRVIDAFEGAQRRGARGLRRIRLNQGDESREGAAAGDAEPRDGGFARDGVGRMQIGDQPFDVRRFLQSSSSSSRTPTRARC